MNELLDKPFAEIKAMPSRTESTPQETICQPMLDFSETTSSYLNFLREMVRVKGDICGEKVAKLFQSRLDALIPYEHKKLYWMHFFRNHDRSLHIAFRPEDFKIVHIE